MDEKNEEGGEEGDESQATAVGIGQESKGVKRQHLEDTGSDQYSAGQSQIKFKRNKEEGEMKGGRITIAQIHLSSEALESILEN
ncbi:hypothetical protein Daesc_004578 [Daldinia eschscholtzii]|uniref:Uncharacterized protein n=1 Tax=Daldinia eschscholtzii TaxID=292717 RepID=A0AAX6MR08_9PEZI